MFPCGLIPATRLPGARLWQPARRAPAQTGVLARALAGAICLNCPAALALEFVLETNYVIESWSVRDGLPHPSVRAVTQTPEGYLWTATHDGIARFDGQRFRHYDPARSGLPGDRRFKSLAVDAGGRVWALTEKGTLLHAGDGGLLPVPAEAGLPPGSPVHGIYADATGQLVASTPSGEVLRHQHGRFEPWLQTHALAAGAFIGINVDHEGTAWVRHGNTLHWWDGDEWHVVTARGDATHCLIALKTGPAIAGGMWIASPQGLGRLQRGTWDERFFAFAAPLSSLQAIVEDPEGNVWVTAGRGGLMRFEPTGRGSRLALGARSAGDHMHHLFCDRDGIVWAGSEVGLHRVRPRARGRGGAMEAGLRPRVDLPAPGVALEEVLADGQRVAEAGGGPVNLPGAPRMLEFRFNAICFDAPREVQFRHRLEGYDADWVTTPRPAAAYTNLPPGRYVFRVTAGRGSGIGNSREATTRVEVPPRAWQTWWFRLSFVGLAAGTGILVLRRRAAARIREREQQDEFTRRLMASQEAERQRIAQELHDSLGQNLLLIKNRAVLGLRADTPPEKLRAQLHEISETSTASVEEIRSIARALRPFQLDRLGLTKTLEDAAGSVGTASGLRVETRVDPVDGLFSPAGEIALFRIVQEGLNNVLKHADATVVRLAVTRNTDAVRIVLADDGRGFDPARAAGFGLSNLRERVRLLGGTLAVTAAPAAGTQLEATIPIGQDNHPKTRAHP